MRRQDPKGNPYDGVALPRLKTPERRFFWRYSSAPPRREERPSLWYRPVNICVALLRHDPKDTTLKVALHRYDLGKDNSHGGIPPPMPKWVAYYDNVWCCIAGARN